MKLLVSHPVFLDLQLLDHASGLPIRERSSTNQKGYSGSLTDRMPDPASPQSAPKIRREVYDPARRSWVAVTPEELVRQALLEHLVHVMHYPLRRIAHEKGIVWNGLQFRFDMLVYGPDMNPFLLVECKAPSVNLSESVLWQITRYNLKIKAPYSLITNGRASCCAALNHESGTADWLEALPPYPSR